MSRKQHDGPDGLAVIDKPPGMTSHDVVARCRKLLGTRKVGHAGTLDPDATGVLLVGVGTVTRLLRFLSPLVKSYECEVVLGTATSTLDDSGEVTGTWPLEAMAVTEADVRRAAAALTGDILQIPPMVSAVQIDGRRLHELAREGIEVDRPPRPVSVLRYDLWPTDDPRVWRAEVDCGSGTYVRSLAADLGTALGGGAHLRRLRRTAIGPHAAGGATALDDLTVAALLTPAAAMAGLDRHVVEPELAVAIGHGKALRRDVLEVEGDGPWALVDLNGHLLAVYEQHPDRDAHARAAVVLATM